jgi:hypothetical protein
MSRTVEMIVYRPVRAGIAVIITTNHVRTLAVLFLMKAPPGHADPVGIPRTSSVELGDSGINMDSAELLSSRAALAGSINFESADSSPADCDHAASGGALIRSSA